MAQPNNPYAAPSAHVADVSTAVLDGQFIEGGRSVPSGHGWQWIADGFDLFKRAPLVWILNLVILLVIIVVLAFIPLLGGLAINLLFPVFFGGLMLGCHALMNGEPLEVAHLFAGFREKAGPLVLLGLLYLVGAIIIGVVVGVFFGFGLVAAIFTGGGQSGINVLMVLMMALLMLALSIPLVMAIWFAPALVVFHDLQPFDALKQSFLGCLKNIVPFLVYGIISLVIGFVAAIPFGLGWLVWAPTLIGSVYAGYRDIYVLTE
jgi:hypothetical protein